MTESASARVVFDEEGKKSTEWRHADVDEDQEAGDVLAFESCRFVVPRVL
eukprot:CAMPEP_0198671722 /NCGR_PEP_ID=MMETSP1467-20131203/87465_1 /TAXON_ID=1462469 /ORGANISM="unid. sp., Strain CCMP2135" /LENGTH=49 /DNA_ID= /DNA_START= /DNA_END= /DNA_ORIENTATION=